MVYIEAEIPLDLIRISARGGVLSYYTDTWKMVDENNSICPKKTPLFKYYKECVEKYKSNYDPFWRVANKIDLYIKIKEEGFNPYKQTRMTCSFDGNYFYIRNGF